MSTVKYHSMSVEDAGHIPLFDITIVCTVGWCSFSWSLHQDVWCFPAMPCLVPTSERSRSVRTYELCTFQLEHPDILEKGIRGISNNEGIDLNSFIIEINRFY